MIDIFLLATATPARYLAVCSESVRPFDLEEGEPMPSLERVSKDLGREVLRIEERREYYTLPVDQFGQPNGLIERVELFPCDFMNIKRSGRGWWFGSYTDALRRALD